MTDYLKFAFDADDPELVSVTDELSLWSAPFGMDLLNTIRLRSHLTVLDIGCGMGFPLLEIAERLGPGSRVIGLDPWQPALSRARMKIRRFGIEQAEVVEGRAERMPFDDGLFDLLVSNNGINNVEDVPKSLAECRRVARPGAQFVMTYNTNGTMRAWYDILETVLKELGLGEKVGDVQDHISRKRMAVEHMTTHLAEALFHVESVVQREFNIDFANSKALFNHHLIKYWFLGPWKEIVPANRRESVFRMAEERIDEVCRTSGHFRLRIPYVTIDATVLLSAAGHAPTGDGSHAQIS